LLFATIASPFEFTAKLEPVGLPPDIMYPLITASQFTWLTITSASAGTGIGVSAMTWKLCTTGVAAE